MLFLNIDIFGCSTSDFSLKDKLKTLYQAYKAIDGDKELPNNGISEKNYKKLKVKIIKIIEKQLEKYTDKKGLKMQVYHSKIIPLRI